MMLQSLVFHALPQQRRVVLASKPLQILVVQPLGATGLHGRRRLDARPAGSPRPLEEYHAPNQHRAQRTRRRANAAVSPPVHPEKEATLSHAGLKAATHRRDRDAISAPLTARGILAAGMQFSLQRGPVSDIGARRK